MGKIVSGVCWIKERRLIHLRHRGSDGKWLTLSGSDDPGFLDSELQKLGIPAAYNAENACLYAVTGQAVEAMDDDEIRAMLTKGAYLDGFALQELNRRGYGEFTGFTVREIVKDDAIEAFLDHPLNMDVLDKRRNGRQSFWYEPAFILEPLPGAEPLSCCVGYLEEDLGGCMSGVFVNSLGGRIAVEGYYPWGTMFYRCQAERIRRLFRWLSKEELPGYVSSYHRAALWVRPGSALLWNMSQDPLRGGRLHLHGGSGSLLAVDVNGRETLLEASGCDENYSSFELPELPPWTVLLCEEPPVSGK